MTEMPHPKQAIDNTYWHFIFFVKSTSAVTQIDVPIVSDIIIDELTPLRFPVKMNSGGKIAAIHLHAL